MPEDTNAEREHSRLETDHVDNDTNCSARMTRWEKCEFLIFPVSWSALAGVPFLVSALFLIAFAVSMLVHFQEIIHHPDRLKNLEPSLVFLAALLVVSGALLIYPVSAFRKMFRRKKESGSIFPCDEELAARRYREYHPPMWLRILCILFFSLIAVGATGSLITSSDRLVLAAWSWPALFWLVAIMVAVDAVWPRPGRQWTGFVASGAFSLLAVLTTVLITRHGKYSTSDLFFPLLMAFSSLFFAVVSVHEGKKKMRGNGARSFIHESSKPEV